MYVSQHDLCEKIIYIENMEQTAGQRLKLARSKRKFTVEKLSQLTGFAESTIRAHQNGQNNIKKDAAETYESAMSLPEGYIMYGIGENGEPIDPMPEFKPEQGVTIRYKVQAGIWEEVFDNESYTLQNYGTAPFLPDENYSINEQWAELVIGDSVNKKFPDGTIVHVRRFNGDYEDWPIGKFVVLQHCDNIKRKRTIKYLDIINGIPTAIGFSTEKKWNQPIIFNQEPEDGEICYIDAVVLKGLIV